MDEIPSAVSLASVGLEHWYDQSGVAATRVPARSPRHPQPAGPPDAIVTAVPPVSPELAKALLVAAATMTHMVTPPKAEDPQWEDIVLPS
jgi:hypothetical protein